MDTVGRNDGEERNLGRCADCNAIVVVNLAARPIGLTCAPFAVCLNSDAKCNARPH